MRVCVIGNSHVAALKNATETAAMPLDHPLLFYALPGRAQPIVSVTEGVLHPVGPHRLATTVTGAEATGLRLADFDAIVLSACGWYAARTAFVDRDPHHHPLGVVASAGWLSDDISTRPETVQTVSQSVFHAVVDAYVRSHASVRLATLLGQQYGGLVLLQPWPAPSQILINDSTWYLNAWYGSGASRVWQAFIEAQHLALDAVADEMGPRVTHLGYPQAETRAAGFMEASWCTKDPWHANEHYGSMVLKQVNDHLNGA
jgi:hypothetical protein